jgi:hypothetical protein
MATVANLAWMANDAYNDKGGAIAGLVAMKPSKENGRNSFFGRVYQVNYAGRRYVIGAVRGTAFESATAGAGDIVNDAQLALGSTPDQQTQAIAFAKEVEKEAAKTRNATLLFTGHSLGGGLVQLIALETGHPALGFCSAGIKGLSSAFSLDGMKKILDSWYQYFGGEGPKREPTQKIAHILVYWDPIVGGLHHAVVGKRKFVTTPEWYGHSMEYLLGHLTRGHLSDLGRRDALDFILT